MDSQWNVFTLSSCLQPAPITHKLVTSKCSLYHTWTFSRLVWLKGERTGVFGKENKVRRNNRNKSTFLEGLTWGPISFLGVLFHVNASMWVCDMIQVLAAVSTTTSVPYTLSFLQHYLLLQIMQELSHYFQCDIVNE